MIDREAIIADAVSGETNKCNCPPPPLFSGDRLLAKNASRAPSCEI
jgi:hypothetical protein